MNRELSANTTLSHYRIVSKIGAGGMGEVYLAQDTKLDRKVAIKFLHEEFSKDGDKLNRFVQEAKAASALNHPNILTVYEIGEVDGKNYIATELIDGQTLREPLSHKEPLPLNTILKIGVQVSEALSAAHQAGIIHRDIKPENIMLRKDGYAKVLDFGLAKLSEPRPVGATRSAGSEDATRVQVNTTPGMVMGTVSYMSPEQARGKETDARTDIWSLGVVLYEMLAGKLPFAGETINHTIVSILEKEPLLLENVPAELQRIVRKSMTKDVEMRYQSARDLLIDLKNLRRDLDIQGELERSITPNRATTTESTQENETQVYAPALVAATSSGQADATHSVTSSSSSLEYAVTQAKSHKLALAIIGVLLVGVISTVGYFAFVSRGGSTKQISSIAVMPFVNESGNADVEYLSDGMTETLIKSLSGLPGLDVKPRSSVFRYKGKDTDLQTVAKALNVQAILNGRVAQHGDQLTLSLELVDVQKNSVIWTEQYQRKQSDLVSLQSEIARDVSTKLKAKLSGAEETKVTKSATADPDAYQAYLKGRYYWNRRTTLNIKKAIEQFKFATDRDPNYALAYAGLADCYAVLHEYAGTPTSETGPQAKAYAERALAIDGQLAEPHATLGSVNELLWQFAESEKEYKRAIELNPNYPTTYHWYSILLKVLGRYDEAAVAIKRAQELDPLSSVIAVNISRLYQLQNNHEASINNSLKSIELDPNFGPAHEYLGLSYLRLGRNAEAITELEKAVELTNRSGITLGDLGYVYAATGKRAEAAEVIKELEGKYARQEAIGQYVAAVYVGLGDRDKAFEWLEKDFQARNGKLAEVRWQLQFETLRDDPRFKNLLKRMGLPE
jgi:serine/threonine protein kinase/tetratricopeptide (TPR) repeat protein